MKNNLNSLWFQRTLDHPKLTKIYQTSHHHPQLRCSLPRWVMFWSGWWQRHSPKPVHCIMLVLRRDIWKGGRGRPPVAVTNSEFPQEFPILDLSCCFPENPDTFYQKIVDIPLFPKRNITKNIYLWKYDENDEEDKDNWEVDYDGDVDPL